MGPPGHPGPPGGPSVTPPEGRQATLDEKNGDVTVTRDIVPKSHILSNKVPEGYINTTCMLQSQITQVVKVKVQSSFLKCYGGALHFNSGRELT